MAKAGSFEQKSNFADNFYHFIFVSFSASAVLLMSFLSLTEEQLFEFN